MKVFLRFFSVLHAFVALLFILAAILLIMSAVHAGWMAGMQGLGEDATGAVIEAIGLAAVAVVSIQIAQTIAEEEVVRVSHVSAPTRVRRFLSRFLVVVVVAVAIEGLIATFKALHDNPEQLPHAAAVLCAVGVMLAGWGVFIHYNREAEELEPEAMQKAKDEDRKLE